MKYEIGILRHSKAYTEGNDLDRGLTPEGEERCIALKEKYQFKWRHVLSSPATRAQQTAYLVTNQTPTIVDALYMNHEPNLQEIEFLLKELEVYTASGPTFVVGHAPMLGPLIGTIAKDNALRSLSFSSGSGVIINPDHTWKKIG